MEADLDFEDLLVPQIKNGKPIHESETLATIRERVQSELSKFHSGILRLNHPHRYPVGLEANLHDLKSTLVLRARGLDQGASV